jgi:hypothetical protein
MVMKEGRMSKDGNIYRTEIMSSVKNIYSTVRTSLVRNISTVQQEPV